MVRKSRGRSLDTIKKLTAVVMLLACAGCAPVVGVRVVRDDAWFLRRQSNALLSNRPSVATTQYLRRLNLEAELEVDLPALVETLQAALEREPDRALTAALAELCYLQAKKLEPRSERGVAYYSTCLLYAHAYLFEDALTPPLSVYDPMFRLACDLYNRSLGAVVLYGQSVGANWGTGVRVRSLLGDVDVRPRHVELSWPVEILTEFEPTFGYEVIGLSNHYRSPGLGLPLIVMRKPPDPARPLVGDAFLPRDYESAAPATVLLTLDGPVRRCGAGEALTAHVDLYDPLRSECVEIGGRRVALETDFTTPFAYMLSKARPVQGLTLLLDPPRADAFRGLYTLTPYQRGKIPVVFVHGLLSPGMKWLQMMNDLMGDPAIRDRYQLWYFEYATGNPVLYSGKLLRESLLEARREFDADGDDAAFDEMVIVGNSMGGLLTRLCIQSGGDRLWNVVTDLPIDDLGLRPEQARTLRSVFYFEPLSFVKRAIFMVTPHRGSRLADSALARQMGKRIEYSAEVTDVTADLYAELRRRDPRYKQTRAGSGIENLSPDNPILGVISTTPMSPRVIRHSIIADVRGPGRRGGTDLIVPYESSHIDDVASEKIVGGTHDSMTNPAAITEVRRILLDHARGL